jgi:proteasome beta subunit
MDEDLKKHVRKTGTTTLGIVTSGGIVIAADKRGIYGGDSGVSYIAGWNQEKISKVNDNIIVTTAGVASDTRKIIKITRAQLKLKELKDKKKPTIKEAANLFSAIVYENIRQPSVIPGITHFLLGGIDSEGIYLYNVNADGFLEKIEDYAASGSGLIHVNPILDSEYKSGLTLKEGIALAKKCVNASSRRDPATGEGIDVYTITKEGINQVVKQTIESVYKEQQ